MKNKVQCCEANVFVECTECIHSKPHEIEYFQDTVDDRCTKWGRCYI